MEMFVADKWYVVESFKSGRGPATAEDFAKLSAHNKGLSKMVLAGPFDSKAEAETVMANRDEDAYVWQCPNPAPRVSGGLSSSEQS